MDTIFFPRHQSRFLRMGDVGSHPQFRHLDTPPEGFEFQSEKLSWVQWLKLLPQALKGAIQSAIDLVRFGRANGVSTWTTLRFVFSRGFSLVPAPKGMATFLPTYPFTHQNEKWFLEIEDVTTLFRPFIFNGKTATVKVRELAAFPLIKKILESENCLGIMTHVKSTQESIRKIFESPVIDAKTKFLAAPYMPPTKITEAALNNLRSGDELQFFFNNSWHQDAVNFYLRGGISILEAFERALKNGLPVRLLLRSKIPVELQERFSDLLKNPRIQFLNQFMDQQTYLTHLRESHYFLLPSARLHVVSLLESMYYGAVPIVSDGWGISDYVTGGKTGYVLNGVYGKVSWADENTGELREDYTSMYKRPGILTEQLYDVIEQVVNNGQHPQISSEGHRFVRDQMSIEKFNPQFSQFLKGGMLSNYNFLESQ